MWNFAFRPLYTDDLDRVASKLVSHERAPPDEIEHFTFGHLGFYNSVGRTEVAPMPMDPDVLKTDIASRSGAYPMLEPAEMRGQGIVRERYDMPGSEDSAWEYSRRRVNCGACPRSAVGHVSELPRWGPPAAPVATLLKARSTGALRPMPPPRDPDSAFGFSARIQDYTYRLLGERPMLASVEAENSPAQPCASDGGRTVCPENWEMRNLYVIEATAKPGSILGRSPTIPKRIFYIDSEGWFITASDQY